MHDQIPTLSWSYIILTLSYIVYIKLYYTCSLRYCLCTCILIQKQHYRCMKLQHQQAYLFQCQHVLIVTVVIITMHLLLLLVVWK